MKYWWSCIGILALVGSVTEVHAQGWTNLLDRVGERVAKKIEDRLSGSSEGAVDKVFDKVDGTVDCVAGDEKCARRASKGNEVVQPGAGASAKCVATDIGCLKEAQARGQSVEIVTEEELDTLRCSSGDTGCLQRAASLGKKVQITD